MRSQPRARLIALAYVVLEVPGGPNRIAERAMFLGRGSPFRSRCTYASTGLIIKKFSATRVLLAYFDNLTRSVDRLVTQAVGLPSGDGYRSKERRVGKECRSRWS